MMVPGHRRGRRSTPRHDRHPRPGRLGLLRAGRQPRRAAHRSPVRPVPGDRLGRHRVVGVPRPVAADAEHCRRRSSSPACSRSRRPLFFVPVAIVYRALRPSETLAEAGERDLTETALEASTTHEACPSCGSPIEDGWRLCPFCRYELLVPCPRCTRPVEMAWSICPWCVTQLPWAREPVGVFADPPPEEPPLVWPSWGDRSTTEPPRVRRDGEPAEEPVGRSPATPL